MPGTGKDGEARRSNVSFTGRVPQAKMATVRITQGTQGRHHRELIGGTCESRTFTGPPFCRRRSIHKTAPRLTRAEIESTSQGPWKLLTKNCINAKETPATSATGQTSRIPRHPDIAPTIHSGMMAEKMGNCRPAIAESFSTSKSVT